MKIALIDSWGSDEGIIAGARMSTGGGFKGWPEDMRLLRYLWRNKHTTPFEFAGATFEVHAPLFVFRQWHRHRTQSYSEISARYAPLPDEHWTPTRQRCLPPQTANKQARGAVDRQPHPTEISDWLESVQMLQKLSEDVYARGLEIGISKEVARTNVLVSRYSTMRASANLLNWLRFVTLRADGHAQEEIRTLAKSLESELAFHFPRTLEVYRGAR